MKLGLRNQESGTITTERVLRKNKGKEEITRENHTEIVGPFSRDEIHARVGCTVGATLSRNYHAVQVSVTINIPCHASKSGVDAGLEWVWDRANQELDEQLKGANRGLDKLGKQRS